MTLSHRLMYCVKSTLWLWCSPMNKMSASTCQLYGVVVKPKKYYDANWKYRVVDITFKVKTFTTVATHFQKCNFYFEGKHLHHLHHTFHSFTNQWVCRAGFFCSNYRWPWQPTSHQSSYKNLFSAVLCISLQSVSACNCQQPPATTCQPVRQCKHVSNRSAG